MNKKSIKSRIVLLLLSFVTIFQAVGCSSKDTEVSLPDYSATNHQFEFTGQMLTEKFTVNGETVIVPELDFYNNVEAIRTFKEMGNTIAKLSRENAAVQLDEDWESSYVNKMGDLLYSEGVTKVYISDAAFLQYMPPNPKILDETSGVFKTEEELDAFVTERLQIYINEPWLYGIDLADEPSGKRATNIAPLTASIRRCSKKLGKELRVYVNLWFSNAPTKDFEGYETFDSKPEAYENYIRSFIEGTDTNQMCVDHYPFLANGGQKRGYFASLQVLRKLCTEYSIEMQWFAQTFSNLRNNAWEYRDIDQSELYYIMNSTVGFGVKTIHWYRYVPSLNYNYGRMDGVKNSYLYDKGSLVDRYGKPTNLYYYAKDIVSEFQSFANVFLNYEYQGAKLYRSDELSKFGVDGLFNNPIDTATNTAIVWDNSHQLKLVKDLQMSNEATLVTELLDQKNKLYMYMVMNPIDPHFSEVGDTTQSVEINFGEEYEWVAEFDQGVLNYVKIQDGVYKKTLSAGYAAYVVPLNKNGCQTFDMPDASKDYFRDYWWK